MTPSNNSSNPKFSRAAIVTGATSGIGEATVRRLVEAGYAVVGNGRNGGKLKSLELELGGAFAGVQGDMAESNVQDALFETALSRFGEPASIVVCNAGRGLGGAISTADLSQFEEVLRTNLSGTLSLMQKAAQHMLAGLKDRPFPQYAADIVVLGSTVGRHVSPFSAVYGATKFAVHSLTEALRRELGPKGIRVSLVEPGIVVSGFQQAAGYNDEQVQRFHDNYGPLIVGDDIARSIAYIVGQPPHLHISDILVRPTRQDYP